MRVENNFWRNFASKFALGWILFLFGIGSPMTHSFAQAPPEEWVARYNGTSNLDDLVGYTGGFAWELIVTDASGNVYVAGGSQEIIGGPVYTTIKYDPNGNEVWKVHYNSPVLGGGYPTAIALDGSGNVYVTGTTAGGRSYGTVKYDANGNELWSALYTGPGNGGDEARAIGVDSAGNVYVTGGSWGTRNFAAWDMTTIKYNSNGTQQWVKRYHEEDVYSFGYDLVVDAVGNVYVTGTGRGGSRAGWVTIKYDTDGNQVWIAYYTAVQGGVIAHALTMDSAGNIYVTGWSSRAGMFRNYTTIKYDSNGNELWVADYNGPANGEDLANDIEVDNSGNVYVTGASSRDAGSSVANDYVTIKYDSNGVELWVARYNGGGDYGAKDLEVDSLGNVYVTGGQIYNTGQDYATVKYDSAGNRLWVKRYNGPGGASDAASSIALDQDGNVFVSGGSGGAGTNLDFATIKYPSSWADLSVSKTDSPDPVLVGDNVIYTITVTNSGPFDATGVTVTDTLPGSVNHVSSSTSQGSCAEVSGIVTCNLGSLANGANATVTITVMTTAEGIITNNVSVTSDLFDTNTSNNSASETTTVNPFADLSIGKSDSPDPVFVNNNLVYTIPVNNNGPSMSTGVTVTDVLPSSVIYLSFSSTQGSCLHVGGTVTCTIGNLANGVTETITITVRPTVVGTLTNTASVNGAEADPDTSNNSAVTTTTVDPTADLSITKTDSLDPVGIGQSLTYTMTITNTGSSNANGVTVTDTLPAEVTYVSSSSSQGSCSEASGTVTCNLGPLGVGSNATISIIVIPDFLGTISNTANVVGDEFDSNMGNNTAIETTEVVLFSVDLSISKVDSPDPVIVNNDLTYTITVINNGLLSASGVTIIDTLPAGVNYVSSFASQGSCSEAGEIVTCNLGSLASGANATTTIMVSTLTVGTISNTASVTGNEPDPNVGNNSVTELTTVGISQLVNISTRGFVGTGDEVMIGGFFIGGTSEMTILIRAQGPSLAGSVPGVLSDPTMQLYSGATVIAQSDDWQTTDPLCLSPATVCGDAQDIIDTGLDPCTAGPTGCSQESAILVTLPPGGYTTIVRGVSNTTGIGLVEIFEISSVGGTKLVNLSTRDYVGTGDNVMIGGLFIGGSTDKTIIIRAIGPTLPVGGTMSNPYIEIYSGATVIATNDDWQTTDPLCLAPAVSCGVAQDIIDAGLAPTNPNESAIQITLPAGGYTAIVRGVGGTTGIGLVEVYEVP